MNLSRAIRLASCWMQGHVVTLRDGEAREYHKLCHEALKRMREQEERSKGCEYCNGLLKSDLEDFTMPNASKQEYDIVTIRFCPMCGRRLEDT